MTVIFDPYLTRWSLKPDGDAMVTATSRLLPVRRGPEAALLKIATAREEKVGAALMEWWGGHGAARVLEREGNALLMERAQGRKSLVNEARQGRDDEATRIICEVITELHRPRAQPPPRLAIFRSPSLLAVAGLPRSQRHTHIGHMGSRGPLGTAST